MSTSYTALLILVVFLCLFIYMCFFAVSLRIEKQEIDEQSINKRKKIPFKWRDLIDGKNLSLGWVDLGNHFLILGIILLAVFIIKNA